MISNSKLGAIGLIAAIGLASPAFAQTQASAIGKGPAGDPGSRHAFILVANPPNYGQRNYAPSQSGGGSSGYNRELETYRLKHHTRSHHAVHQ
jgi:hypothetical protein